MFRGFWGAPPDPDMTGFNHGLLSNIGTKSHALIDALLDSLILAMTTRGGSTWTPTLSNTTNVTASTAYQGQYIQVENTVHASVWLDADPTVAGLCKIGLTLPIASNFASVQQCIGFGSSYVTAGPIELINVTADPVNKWANVEWNAAVLLNHGCLISFTYRVLP